MARPAPVIIDSYIRDDTVVEILDRPNVYWVEYEGAPISLRTKQHTSLGETIRYPRTAFNNRAHCENLAAELNARFQTNKYTVASLHK